MCGPLLWPPVLAQGRRPSVVVVVVHLRITLTSTVYSEVGPE